MKPIVMRPPLGDEPIKPRIEKNDSQDMTRCSGLNQ